jgi:hypothetical protein
MRLLEQFSVARNKQAPAIYKALVGATLENIADSVAREFLLHNFINLFKTHPTIPISILIDPLLH